MSHAKSTKTVKEFEGLAKNCHVWLISPMIQFIQASFTYESYRLISPMIQFIQVNFTRLVIYLCSPVYCSISNLIISFHTKVTKL